MIQNIKLCECCRRVMPSFSKGLFCEDCKRGFKELSDNKEKNDIICNHIIAHLINGGSILVKKEV